MIDITDLPQIVPSWINDSLDIKTFCNIDKSLPMGVVKRGDKYLAICFYGDIWDVHEHRHFDTPKECHTYWQEMFCRGLRQVNQYYTYDDLFDPRMSKCIRQITEWVESQIKNGEETVL